MAITDPISDMFVRLRNALLNSEDEVVIPHSKMKVSIIKILKEEGFIRFFEILNAEAFNKSIKVGLKYAPSGQSVISTLRRVSKPSKRIYIPKDKIPKVLNGFGTCILSTSKGVLNGKSARLANVGGEFIGIIS